MQKSGGKQATRGQRQIYQENQNTIFYYSLASVVTSSLCFFLFSFVINSSYGTWTGWVCSSLMQLCAIAVMKSMIKNVKNEKNQVVDAGLDLNDPEAFGEYCKDTVILCCGAHLSSLISKHFYWVLIILPSFALYKLWTKLLAPWFFAQPYELDDSNDKKRRKREKKIFIRR